MKLFSCLLLLLAATASAACPFCNSPTAANIRNSLFGADFFFNLFVIFLPFAVFAIIVLLIYHGGWRRKSSIK